MHISVILDLFPLDIFAYYLYNVLFSRAGLLNAALEAPLCLKPSFSQARLI